MRDAPRREESQAVCAEGERRSIQGSICRGSGRPGSKDMQAMAPGDREAYAGDKEIDQI